MAAPAGSRLRLVCSNCTTLCEVSIPASATQKPVRYQVRCPNCKTVNDPQIARTTNGVAEVVGPNSSAKRKASPTVRAYASPLCAFRAHAPRSLAAQNGGPPPKRVSPPPPKRPPSNGAGSSSDVKPEPEPPSGPRVDEILQMRPAARGHRVPRQVAAGGGRERRAARFVGDAVGARSEGDLRLPRAPVEWQRRRVPLLVRRRRALAKVEVCRAPPPHTPPPARARPPPTPAARTTVNRGSSRIQTTRRRR